MVVQSAMAVAVVQPGVVMRLGVYRFFSMLWLALMAASALAADAPAATSAGGIDQFLKTVLEKRLGGPRVDAVVKLPNLPFYEAQVGKDVVYIDPKGEYIFLGNIINTRTGENLTQIRTDALTAASQPKIKFGDFPFASAIKFVKGNGKRQIVIFADPNCVYCKRFEQTLAQVTDLTVYVFLIPILGPDSVEKTRLIWCSGDRATAWTDWMLRGTAPTGGAAPCSTPTEKLLGLAKTLQIDATPTLVFADGKRVAGAVRLEDLQRILAEVRG